MARSLLLRVTVLLVVLTAGAGLSPATPPAAAFNPIKPICSATGLVSGLAGKLCSVASHPGKVVSVGKKLLGGHVGGAVKTLLGDGSGAAGAATTAVGLAAIGAWVIGGARFALDETAKVLGATTSPELQSTWFSSAYWRMAGIAALLTLPFLFAAAIQALVRSDLALLARAAFGYLPLALLAVGIAAPLTTLLLAASDEMSAIVSAAAGNAGAHFLGVAGATIGALSLASRSPFLAFLIGLLTAAGALTLWVELLLREAAVYVIVLMLPLVFAALVWPARRVWAVRSVELLVALVLSKFAIVAVLALGGAALNHGVSHGASALLLGLVLVVLGAFAPWALLALLPLHELASGAMGSLRSQARPLGGALASADSGAYLAESWIDQLPDRMRAAAGDADQFDRSAGARSTLATLAEDTGDPGSGGEPASGAAAEPDGFDHGATEAASGSAPLDSAGPGTWTADGDLVAQAVDSPGDTSGSAAGAGVGFGASAGAAAGPGASGAAGPGAGASADAGTGAAGAGTGAGARTGAAGADTDAGATEEERLPDLAPMYHQDDESWRTLILGPDDPGPQGPLWQPPARADGSGSGTSPSARAQDPRPGPAQPAQSVTPELATGDDVDPLPAQQDADQGRL
jgi:hypothetical protein